MHSELLEMELLINPITLESWTLGPVSVEGGAFPVGEMNSLPVHICPRFVLITVYMIGGAFRQGGLPDLPDSVTLSAVVTFYHLDVSRWGG